MVLSSSFVPSPIDLGLIIALCIASGMRFGQEMFSACWVERLKSWRPNPTVFTPQVHHE